MAFIVPDDEQQKIGGSQPQQTPTSNETVLSAPSAVSPTTAGAPGPAEAKGTHSGSFTNLSSYVNANKGNDVAIGQDVTNRVQAKAQDADTKLQGWQQAARDQINKGTVTANPNLVTALNAAPTSINKDAYRAATAGYQGPKIDQVIDNNYATARNAATDVQNYARQAGSEDLAKRGAVLRDVYGQGGKQYSSGENRLDSFILGAGDGGKEALKNITANFGTYGTKADAAKNAVADAIAQGQKTSDETKTAVENAAKNAYAGVENRISGAQAALSGKASSAEREYSDLVAALKSPDAYVRTAAAKKIGLDPDIAEYYAGNLGGDLSTLVSKGATQGLGDVVDAEDQGKYAALADLLGITPQHAFTKTGNQAGTAYGIDTTGVERAKTVVADARAKQAAAQEAATAAATATPQVSLPSPGKIPEGATPLSDSLINNRNPIIASLPQTMGEMAPTSINEMLNPAKRSANAVAAAGSPGKPLSLPVMQDFVDPKKLMNKIKIKR